MGNASEINSLVMPNLSAKSIEPFQNVYSHNGERPNRPILHPVDPGSCAFYKGGS